jgi:lipid II:glycine glycyltransferase (peptidoglycan interpeptide bridge formation enzyme)
MSIRPATPDEIASWDMLLAANPDGGNVFQSHALGETKRLGGWKPLYLRYGDLALTVLEKRVPLLGRYWYLPKGPGLTSIDAVLDVTTALSKYAHDRGIFAIKIEPELLENDDARYALQTAGLIRTNSIQPNVSTVIIDLSLSLEDIMSGLNQKGRHAIHRAERDGVRTEAVPLTEHNMHIMYDLLRDTAAGRFESSLRSYDYYATFWARFAEGDRGSLFFAYVDDQVVAAAFCMYLGHKGLYKDGASIRKKTVYGASHLLQWRVIEWMKSHGVESYDLCGAPHSTRINDESGAFYGVGRFKTSFNKHITDYVGCYDIAVKPGAYRIWQRIGQRFVVSLNYRLKHDQWF